ncbi:hypothetical protein BAME_16600 [Bacillus sp. M 2-6]|nr:hypothetical protein BAME_16600 [Bacillus sp. M 2-6]KIL25435.1 hypothetical protein B4133_3826 [Bacillus altitudinis]VWA42993.1 hypothetical protein [Bacillus altitudinis]
MREEKQLCNLHVLETSHHFMRLTAYMPFIYQASLQIFTSSYFI